MTTIESLPQDHVDINYSLSSDERVDLYRSSMASILSSTGDRLLDEDGSANVLMVPYDHPLANVARSIEAEALPNTKNWLQEYEQDSRFLLVLPNALSDEEAYKNTPAHIFRLNSNNGMTSNSQESMATGLPTMDDFLKMGLATEDELLEYYDVPDLLTLGTRYLDVPGNVSVEGVKRSIKNPYSAIGYKAIFEVVREENLRGVVAYQNDAALSSLSHIGIKHHPLCGDSARGIDDDDAVARGENQPGRYNALTIEATPWSLLVDGSAEHNTKMFGDPEYATQYSRLAALVAKKYVNLIKVL